ncbi:MAG: hypothetical protein PWP04_5 [Candidatus Atribacteria bacterium]|nr:hypothetical protein [Candidatus Atribacteria bacterium]
MGDKKVKIGMIGLGRISKTHLKSIAQLKEAELTAVCDVNEGIVKELSLTYGIEGFTDYRKLIAYPEVEAIMVLTPPETHFEIVNCALEANKHIFCEKPLTSSLKEAYKMKEQVVSREIVFQIGFTERYNEGYRVTRQAISDGLVGIPFIMRSKRDIPGSFVENIDWIKDSNRGGGPLVECLIHDIDLAHWYFESKVVTVTASAYRARFKHFDNVSLLLEFQSGAIANLSSSWSLSDDCQWCAFCELIGSEGSIEIKNPPESWVKLSSKKAINVSYPFIKEKNHGNTIGLRNISLDLPHYSLTSGAYLVQLRSFIDCILYNQKPLVGIDEGISAFEVVIAALKSIQENKKVTLG